MQHNYNKLDGSANVVLVAPYIRICRFCGNSDQAAHQPVNCPGSAVLNVAVNPPTHPHDFTSHVVIGGVHIHTQCGACPFVRTGVAATDAVACPAPFLGQKTRKEYMYDYYVYEGDGR